MDDAKPADVPASWCPARSVGADAEDGPDRSRVRGFGASSDGEVVCAAGTTPPWRKGARCCLRRTRWRNGAFHDTPMCTTCTVCGSLARRPTRTGVLPDNWVGVTAASATPTHACSQGEVGKCGVSVASLADMERLFDGIDLGRRHHLDDHQLAGPYCAAKDRATCRHSRSASRSAAVAPVQMLAASRMGINTFVRRHTRSRPRPRVPSALDPVTTVDAVANPATRGLAGDPAVRT